MSCRRLLFDTGPLSSFAAVGQLDLLEAICAGHGAWPLSVQRELRAGARVVPALVRAHQAAFLGVPEVLARPADLLEAELLRARLAGSSLGPRRNRGEAEAIFLARRRGGVFVSEDRDALVLAAGELGPVRVVDTPGLLARAVRTGLVEPEEAWTTYRAMLAAGRRLGRLNPDLFGHRPRQAGNADGASVGGAVWTSGPPLGGGRSRGSKG